jgi:hypothetical protein
MLLRRIRAQSSSQFVLLSRTCCVSIFSLVESVLIRVHPRLKLTLDQIPRCQAPMNDRTEVTSQPPFESQTPLASVQDTGAVKVQRRILLIRVHK